MLCSRERGVVIIFVFFQAEGGIRGWSVTEFRRVLFRSPHVGWYIYFAGIFPGPGWGVLREDAALSGTRAHAALALRSGLVFERETGDERDPSGAASDDVALVRGEIYQRRARGPPAARPSSPR